MRAEQDLKGKFTLEIASLGDAPPALLALDPEKPLIHIQAEHPRAEHLAQQMAEALCADFGFSQIGWLLFNDDRPTLVPQGPLIKPIVLRKENQFEQLAEKLLEDSGLLVVSSPRSRDFSAGKLWYLLTPLIDTCMAIGIPLLLIANTPQEGILARPTDGRFVSQWDASVEWQFVGMADHPGEFLMTYRPTGQSQLVRVSPENTKP